MAREKVVEKARQSTDGEAPDAYALLALYRMHAAENDGDPTRVFVLGINERRVTLYSQQCRALNLIWLLHVTGVLDVDSGDRVAVVGAGAGGLTAAAAAACTGHEVLLLNEAAEPMPHQRFARHRWLHPHIFDWPRKEWLDEKAGLPLLDWKASNADHVRSQLIKRFDEAGWSGPVDYHGGVEAVKVEPARGGDSKPSVTWSGPDAPPERVEASVVVLAVGFGLERNDHDFFRPPVYHDSYWDDPGTRWSSPGKVLISGGGDGGLTEVLHAALGEPFEHEKIVGLAGAEARGRDSWRECKWVGDIRSDVLRFEERWRHRERPPAREVETSVDFFARKEFDASDGLLKEMADRGQPSAAERVTLVVKEDDLAPKSCALNRFLLARLESVCQREPGLPRIERLHSTRFDMDDPQLRKSPPFCFKGVEAKTVVIRHGTSRDKPIERFTDQVKPDIDSEEFADGTRAALLDATRHRCWPDGFYKGCRNASGRPKLPADPEVLTARDGATHVSPGALKLDVPARVAHAALVAAALVDVALTPAGIARVLRSGRKSLPDVLRRLGANTELEANSPLTIDDALVPPLRSGLLGPEADARAWSRKEDGRPRLAETPELGHLRAGTLLGAVDATRQALLDADDEGEPPVQPVLSELPWWTAYGYAAVRTDHAPTQLAFARQLMERAARTGKTVPDHVWDAADIAIRRAIRAQLGARAKDPVVLAAALFDAGDFARRASEATSGRALEQEEMGSDFAEGYAERCGTKVGELPSIATLFALRALEPPRPAFFPKWLHRRLRGGTPLEESLRTDRLTSISGIAEDALAADLLRSLEKTENDRVAPREIDDAATAIAAESPAAKDHVEMVLKGR